MLPEPYEDSRRLTGSNLYFDGTGAALETARELVFDAATLDCWRANVVRALDREGRRFRVAYISSAALALSGAVLAGLAVSVLPESALKANMRILGAREGFPELEPAEIGLLRAEHAKSPIHDALAKHIVTSLGNHGATDQVMNLAAE